MYQPRIYGKLWISRAHLQLPNFAQPITEFKSTNFFFYANGNLVADML